MAISVEDLKKMSVWVNWKLEERDGKQTKIPYNPHTGGRAQSNNPTTWSDFNFAQSKSDNYNGLGFMFADGICGIDIDNKKGSLELDKQAETIINLMDTYTERSPSGTGWHIIFKCDMSKIPTVDGKLDSRYYYKNPHNDLECYFPGLTNRYFTYTEQGNGKNIEDRTEQILIFIENYMLKDNFKAKNVRQERTEASQPYQTSTDILEKARKSKNGIKFSALYDRGDISDYNNDDSSADLALCSMLAWWLQGNFNEIDHYFRQSALYREKWERKDYRTTTINKAIDNCNGRYYTPPGRPKTKKNTIRSDERTDNERSRQDDIITIARTDEYLKQINISIKYNQITRDTDIQGEISKYDPEHIKNNLLTDVYDQLKLIYKKCPKRDFVDHIAYIASRNRYNPVLNMIEGTKWDGIDRLPELYVILCIAPDDKLSQALIFKWYWQNLSMARNERGEYGADGVLVLQGTQGIGKTTLARKSALKDEFFGEGLHVDIKNKDSIIEATSCWIGELGEIESTFKSDINALKAFITRTKDIYRMPYAADFDKLSRRTSFIGTCNSEQFLIDETGNRRFWTVPVKEIDRITLNKFNFLQLYLQIDQEYAKNNIQGFRLTENEQKLLAERNSTHEKPIKAEEEIRDIIFKAERDNLLFEDMTVTEFKELYPVLRYDVREIGRALNKIGIGLERKWKDGKIQRLASLPRPKYRLDIKDFN